MQPLVSIIIPTYNRAHLIGETLESVIAQTYQNWECIVVDDGSTDATSILIEFYCNKDSRIQFHHRPKERLKGANACRNFGFELSKGEFINWFDDDDFMLPNFLKDKINNFSKTAQIVVCSGFIADEYLQRKCKMKFLFKKDLYKGFVMWKNEIITNSILFKRSYLLDKNLFLPDLHRGQEAEFFSRILFDMSLKDYIILDNPLFLYRQHSDTISFKNRNYVPKYRRSQAIYGIANFRRGLQIKDPELVIYFYEGILDLFFEGIDNKDFSHSTAVLLEFTKSLFYQNPKLAFKLFTGGMMLLLARRNSFRIRKVLKSMSVEIKL